MSEGDAKTKKLLNKIGYIIEKVGKHNFILIVFIILVIVITGLYQTFSLYTSSEGVSIVDGLKTFKFILGNPEENMVTIAAGTSKNVAITISNKENIKLKYGIYYSSSDDLTNVDLGYSPLSDYPANGLIEANSDYIITIKIYNDSTSNVTIHFGTIYGFESGGDLTIASNQHFLDMIYPYKYEVEYLESTGTQYIDTKVAPNNINIKVELQYQYTSNLNTGNDSAMGSREYDIGTTRFYPSSLSGTTVDRHIYGAQSTGDLGNGISTVNDYERHTVLFNDEAHNCYVDGALLGNFDTTFTPHEQDMYLFALNTEGTAAFYSASRIYYCKIWDNGILVRDYIPVIDRSGVPSLYDKVHDTLYYNQDSKKEDFYTNFVPKEVNVSKNFQVSETNLRSINNTLPSDATITDIVVKDSSNNSVTILNNYDVYTLSFLMNGREVTQKVIPVPSTSITLTNVLNNAGFEDELTNYYNGTALRSNAVKRSGDYSMFFTTDRNIRDNTQSFLIFKYGNIGAKDHDVYVRTYTRTDNSNLWPILYVYELETADSVYGGSQGLRSGSYYQLDSDGASYNKWTRLSAMTSPSNDNFEYFMLMYSQGNGNATGNTYWDDSMAIVIDTNTWEQNPTKAWMDEMIPDFTGTQTFTW